MKRLLHIFVLAILYQYVNAQSDFNPIPTAINFTSINPDVRGSALGGVGTATSPDAFSAYYNPAKIAFMKKELSVALSYAPYLERIVKKENLSSFYGYKKLNDLSGIGLEFRYRNYGITEFKDANGLPQRNYKPYEMAIGASYGFQVSDYGSVGVTFRYLQSNPAPANEFSNGQRIAASGIGADIGYYYTSIPVNNLQTENNYRFGVAIKNIGNKINYKGTNNTNAIFQPMTLSVGGGYTFANEDNENSFTLSADINKLLVPTPPVRDANGNITSGKDPDIGVPSSIFRSFGDAPGGFKEELKEFTASLGLEYTFLGKFALRGGMGYQSPLKGVDRFVGFGFGYRHPKLGLDLSYQTPFGNKGLSTYPESLKLGFVFHMDEF